MASAQVMLRNAPDGMDPVQMVRAADVPDRLTLPFYGRNQHFERTDETELEMPVFRFTHSTAIAE